MALSDLLPASFRGVPFAVVRAGGQFGRRANTHEYPGRDTPWTEDLGRKARQYRFTGFLLEGDLTYGGGPIDLQRALLVAACEVGGSGLLTHPTLGILTVSGANLSIDDDVSADNYCGFELSLVEAGGQSFPSILISTGDGVLSAVVAGAITVASDAASAITVATSTGGSGEPDLYAAASAWSAQVLAAGQDATAVLSLTSLLPGSYGRFSAGANAGFATTSLYVNNTTVPALVSSAASARADIRAAVTTLLGTITGYNATGDASDIASAVQALVTALNAACANPADAVRLLLALQAYDPGFTTSGGIAVGDTFRRAAVCTLAQASASYQPSSYDDAAGLLGQITSALDDEIEVAGDEGADDTFNSLRLIRQNVVQDLTKRGATLARVKTFSLGATLPDSVVAQIIYRDPSRADQLTTQVDEVHPLFMPASFRALAQ